MITPTERQLRIPAALACKYAARARRRGIDPEDLESAAGLAFAKALAAFDPDRNRNGEAGFSSFAYQNCLWAIKKLLARPPRASVSLDAPSPEGESYGDFLAVEPAPQESAEPYGELTPLLAGLSSRDAAVLRLLADGHPLAEVGRRLGVTCSRAGQIAARARRRARLRSISLGAGCGMDNSRHLLAYQQDPDNVARREAKRRAAHARAMSEMRPARQALGVVRPDGWYLVAPDGRCWGDWLLLEEALAAVGIPARPTRVSGPRPWLAGCLGWVELPLAQALVAAALGLAPERGLGVAELAAATGLLRGTVPTAAQRLCARGWAQSTGRRGPYVAAYQITAAALAARGPQTPLRPVRGRGLPRDCRPLPPHLVERVAAPHPDVTLPEAS